MRESGIARERIDAVVQELYRVQTQNFDCRTCANCCKAASPHLDREDVRRLAKRLHRTQADFKRLYLVKDDTFGDFGFSKKPCPLLVDDLCIVYPDHPRECREYPHLDKPGIVTRLINLMENYPVCPIIFNVVERLKVEIWPKESR